MSRLADTAVFVALDPRMQGTRMYRIFTRNGSYVDCGPCFDHSQSGLHGCRIEEIISEEPCSTATSIATMDAFFQAHAIKHHRPGKDGKIPTNPSGPCTCDICERLGDHVI